MEKVNILHIHSHYLEGESLVEFNDFQLDLDNAFRISFDPFYCLSYIDYEDADNSLRTVLNCIDESDCVILYVSSAVLRMRQRESYKLRFAIEEIIKENKPLYVVKQDDVDVNEICSLLKDCKCYDFESAYEIANDFVKQTNV
ncbi:MAG: hypothetical protein LUI06_04810 [Ruminococcus sp.]|nr:hypothetical protein [Ruminococcus sp.]